METDVSAKAARGVVEKMRLRMKVNVATIGKQVFSMVLTADDATGIIFASVVWQQRMQLEMHPKMRTHMIFQFAKMRNPRSSTAKLLVRNGFDFQLDVPSRANNLRKRFRRLWNG